MSDPDMEVVYSGLCLSKGTTRPTHPSATNSYFGTINSVHPCSYARDGNLQLCIDVLRSPGGMACNHPMGSSSLYCRDMPTIQSGQSVCGSNS